MRRQLVLLWSRELSPFEGREAIGDLSVVREGRWRWAVQWSSFMAGEEGPYAHHKHESLNARNEQLDFHDGDQVHIRRFRPLGQGV